jgi:hypothetical protein
LDLHPDAGTEEPSTLPPLTRAENSDEKGDFNDTSDRHNIVDIAASLSSVPDYGDEREPVNATGDSDEERGLRHSEVIAEVTTPAQETVSDIPGLSATSLNTETEKTLQEHAVGTTIGNSSEATSKLKVKENIQERENAHTAQNLPGTSPNSDMDNNSDFHGDASDIQIEGPAKGSSGGLTDSQGDQDMSDANGDSRDSTDSSDSDDSDSDDEEQDSDNLDGDIQQLIAHSATGGSPAETASSDKSLATSSMADEDTALVEDGTVDEQPFPQVSAIAVEVSQAEEPIKPSRQAKVRSPPAADL